jgi:hypothetical protein
LSFDLVSVVVVVVFAAAEFFLESVQFWVTNRRENQKKEGKGKGKGREGKRRLLVFCFGVF